MRIAYLDCFSGLSGDMLLGALVDAGVSPKLLEDTVAALGLGARLEIKQVDRSGITATKVDVWVGGEKELPREEFWKKQRDHGHHHDHPADTAGSHHQHHHEHPPDTAGPHRHTHEHRGLQEIRAIIGKASISDSAKQKAIATFEALGAAEAKIHNKPIEQIHFHEVGAVDAIVDIVCAMVGVEALGVDEWVGSPVNVGGGRVKCAHGEFPVPAPATVELLKDAPVFSSGIELELVTPTGAALLHTLVNRFAPVPGMKIERAGYGAGSRDIKGHANVCRILLGTTGAEASVSGPVTDLGTRETISVLEANLDDLNPQVFGYVMDRALAEGALDVFGTPVQMKKNRPGMLLTVLCKPEDAQRMARLFFTETTTLGVRMREEKRQALLRRTVTVKTAWGEVRLKVANLNGTVANYAPEFEDCRRLAAEHSVPLKQVMAEALRAYQEQLK